MTPSGMLNDAVSIYFFDATLASAFVARWCAGSSVETEGGVFRIRDDKPVRRLRVFGQRDKLKADRSKGYETWA